MQHKNRAYLSLIAVYLLLPLVAHIHPFVSLFTFGILAISVAADKYFDISANYATSFLVSIIGVALVFTFQGRPVGVIPASAILFIAMVNIIIRPFHKKDMILFFLTGSAISICATLLEQTLMMTLYMICSFIVLLHFLAKSTPLKARTTIQLKTILRLFLIVSPAVIILFFVIPRTQKSFIPPILRPQISSGFDSKLDPGTIQKLIQSDELAFKARIETKNLKPADLYWRGKTLALNEGMVWNEGPTGKGFNPLSRHTAKTEAETVETQIILEPKYQKWIFALDVPVHVRIQDVRWNQYLKRSQDHSYFMTKDVSERLLIDTVSIPLKNFESAQASTNMYLQMPSRPSPRVEDLIKKLSKESQVVDSSDFADQLGKYLLKEKYTYTLSPGAMPEKSIDYFIFEMKRGFCEHYSAMAAYLFRAAGIPSRIVLGFHGGELNNIDGYYSIRGRDAHAWTEYYSNSLNQWIRFDATHFLAPDRINNGGQQFHISSAGLLGGGYDFLPKELASLLKSLSLQLSAFSTQFNLFMLTFDFSSQKSFFRKFNIEIKRSHMIGVTLAIILVIVLLAVFLRRRKRLRRDPVEKTFYKFKKALNRHGVEAPKYISPTKLLEKINQSSISNKREIRDLMNEYIRFRYGKPGSHHLSLDIRKRMARLSRRMSSQRPA